MRKMIPVMIAALLAGGIAVFAQQKGGKGAPKALKWRVQQLQKSNNEGAAAGDINGDGKMDVVAGEFWYAAPDFKGQKVRKLLPFGKDYIQNNSEYLYDVDGDGDLDIVAGAFTLPEIRWYENTGKYDDPAGWPSHVLCNTGTNHHEATFLHDIDGDGSPEWLESSWKADNPMVIWHFVKGEDGKPALEAHTVCKSGQGHGIGFGDLNSDGKQDIIFTGGWYECPADGPYSGEWEWHKDFILPHASCPILVLDLDEDGDSDFIWADGHNYGLYWHEQMEPQSDGTLTFRQHLIDKKFSQAHTLAWDDIDNDGAPELITGKRYYAHSGNDPGADDPTVVLYFDWNKENQTWKKNVISSTPAGEGPGVGLQINVVDMNDDGWKDLVVPGKSGSHIIWNEGWTKPE